MVCPDLSHLSMTSSSHVFHFLTIVSVACFEDNYKGGVQNKMRVLIISPMHLTVFSGCFCIGLELDRVTGLPGERAGLR